MTFFGIVIVLFLSLGFDIINHRFSIEKDLDKIKKLSDGVAQHMESHIKERTTIALTISSAPLIKKALQKSNASYSTLSPETRRDTINMLNQKWRNTTNKNDTFIQKHMANPVADFLRYQQTLIPGEYGEIFLTNRYGVMIATTGKLTTLAHAHKYWWLASYNDGQSRIFIDDRGFDSSVQGYVLGVVIPIINNGEMLGILKCNVNIIGSLTDVLLEFEKENPGSIKIVRTGGLVVLEDGSPPLSTQLSKKLVNCLSKKKSSSAIITENDETNLVASSPIMITAGSREFGFGGSKESVDHIKGNLGEGWHVLMLINSEYAFKAAHDTTWIIVIVGSLFTIITTLIAFIFCKYAAKPIVELAVVAQAIGDGHLDTSVKIHSKDEIGTLAKSLHQMAQKLKSTMTSRDNLAAEKEAKEKVIADLKIALDDIDTLSGIIPICAHCKGIRDDKGYWIQLEKYISDHSEAEFSHGMCDTCLNKLYPENND